ncbi:MAG: hypothetical protein HYY16_08040 [Planctomycetes bacterium]|nr:hypothetical protein [Planctomycetota bacterium]
MRALACVVAMLATAATALAQDDYVGGRYRLWQADFEGQVRADDQGVMGTDIDVESMLDIRQNLEIPDAAIWIGAPHVGRLIADYWRGEFEGDETLTTDVSFAGTTFSAGEQAHTEFEWRVLTAAYEYNFDIPLVSDLVSFRLGLGAGVKLVRLRGELTTSTTSNSENVRGPLPVLRLSGEFSLGTYLSIGLEADGLSVSDFEGTSGRMSDVAVFVRGGYGGAFLGVGVRRFLLHVEGGSPQVDEVELDASIGGAFLEAGLRF